MSASIATNNFMNQGTKQTEQNYQVFTNSIIKVSIPDEYRELGKVLLEWTANPDDEKLGPTYNFLGNSQV